jgi:catechol 2,3-dioxygenase-like lactoylglutathione lyase family enzyme
MNLNQISLPVTDLARAAAFYRSLGFTQIVSSPPLYARFECEGGATFSLHHVESVPSSEFIVYFECEALDAVYERLKAGGIAFEQPPTDQRWLWREAYLRDPDGNVLCLYQAGVNRRFPPWRIAAPP